MRRDRTDLWPAAAALLLAAMLGSASLFRLLPESLQVFSFGIAGAGVLLLLSAAAIRLSDFAHAHAVTRELRPPEVTFVDTTIAHPAGEPPAHLFYLPWYIVLGRGECGKSSLIRALAGDSTPTRFAPGGVDCWATSHAVFIELNTPGTSLASDEPAINLLSFLKRHRAHRPISGLILALPADRLLKANAEQAVAAATTINARLDEIRQAVAARFPVYVALTRADRLLGFRELTALTANQSHDAPWLGWVNPAHPDQPPAPDDFDAAINSLRTQAIRRRTALLSPPPSEPLPSRAFDRLDSAYALPDSIARLSSPLRTLLSSVFTVQQPHLFFRGLFLTAAYPAGPAIDPDAPSRPAAIRHDAATPLCPLHPLLTGHILPECNLVTPAHSVDVAYRHRRDQVAAACALAAVVPTLVAIAGSLVIQDGPRAHLSTWQSIASRYATPSQSPDQASALAAADLAHQALAASQRPLATLPALPFVHDPAPEVRTLRDTAARAIFQSAALGPILAASANKLANQAPQDWAPASTAALLEVANLTHLADSPVSMGRQEFLDLSALLTFLSFDPLAAAELSRLCDSLYPPASQQSAAKALLSAEVRRCLAPALTVCLEHYDGLASGRFGELKRLADLRAAALEFQSALTDISGTDVQAVAADWPNLFDSLKAAASQLDAAAAPLTSSLTSSPEVLCKSAATRLLVQAAKDRDGLRTAFAASPALVSKIDAAFRIVEVSARQTTASFEQELPPLIAQHLIPDSRASDRPFEARLKLFAAANALLAAPLPSVENSLGQLASSISSNLSSADSTLATIKLLTDRSPLLRDDAATATTLVESRRRHILAATLRAATASVNLPPDDFGRLCDDFALRSNTPIPSLPEFPFCPGSGGRVQPRFSPDAARRIFSDWTAISRLARGQEISDLPSDELAALLESFESARTTYTRFAAEYIRYWSSLPDTVAAPQAPAWPEISPRLRAIRPAQVNASYRSLLNSTSVALTAVPLDLGQDDALLAARTRISAEIAELDKPWFDDACRRARDKWAALSTNSEYARADLLKLAAPRFQADYLEIYAEGARGVRYWNRLLLASLSTLAAADTSRREVAESLIRDTRLFPLCADADPSMALSPAELVDARRLAASVIKSGLAAAPDSRDRTLGNSARTEYPLINDQLAHLAGNVLSFDEKQDAWSHKLRTVLGFLDPEAPQFCELFVFDGSDLDPPTPDSTPIAPDFPYLQISIGSAPPLAPLSTICPSDRAITFALPGPTLHLRLLPADPTAEGALLSPIELPAPWNVILLLREPAATVDDTADASGRLARVPLVFTDHAGRTRHLWLGIRFQRPPPALADWPEQADWPD